MEMQLIVASSLTNGGWGLAAVAIAFLLSVFACSVFSLQMCMAYFGEEIPSYWGCAALKVKVIIGVCATMLVAYAFLGPLSILGAPAGFVVALMMIGNAARCDRFHSAIIVVSHGAITVLATGLCTLVCWVGLTTMGFDASSLRDQVARIRRANESYGALSDKKFQHSQSPPRNVSHSNPFLSEAGSSEEDL